MYLSVDVETGGIGLDKSLLTLGLVFANENFVIEEEVEYSYIPDDGIYHVDPKGMEVNGIDLVKLSKEAVTYSEGASLLYKKLQRFYSLENNKLIVVGKNVWGDCLQIWDKLLKRGSWENFCSYRQFDVTSVHMMLRAIGKIPEDVNGSLKSLCEYYEIPSEGYHNALADAKMTLRVLEKMVQSIS